jgi:hypothetical protein
MVGCAGEQRARIAAQLMKDTNGFKSASSVDGAIANFQFVSDLRFPGGNQVIDGVKGMGRRMRFQWEIGKDTPCQWAQKDKLSLAVGASIPLAPVLDGLPLSIGISAAFLILATLSGGNEYSKGVSPPIGWEARTQRRPASRRAGPASTA